MTQSPPPPGNMKGASVTTDVATSGRGEAAGGVVPPAVTPDDQRAAVECMALAFHDIGWSMQNGTNFATAALRALLDAGWSVSRTSDAEAERLRSLLHRWVHGMDLLTGSQMVALIEESEAALGEARDG